MKGKTENGKFTPFKNQPRKGVTKKSVNSSSTGDESLKGLPKSFRGYDVMNRKKVKVTEGIKKIKFKNGRNALQGKSPIAPHITVTHIVSSK